jgi:phenylpropionate dioxygenase-like ring-hydroxylating dioxygenase large terminal subunit
MATPARKVARSAGISYQELLDGDTVPPEDTLRRVSPPLDVPLVSVPVDRYRSPAFHDLEMKRLWPRVWQMACREEEIPEVGDYVVYEIGSYSILVVRTQNGVRAQHNVCRHRGRKLCTDDGHVASFICPFHGMSWNLDGSLRGITSEWDFPHIDKKNFDLNKVLCDTWGGWVFINMDLKAEPLAKFLGDLPEHFAVWSPEKRYIEAHVAKIMSCNWKLCQEAFMEAFHVITTHPQILVGIGDENSQYDAWGNFSRAITPNGTPSPHLRFKPSEQELFDSVTMKYLDAEGGMELPEGTRARAMLAEGARMALRSIVGEDTTISDASVSDSIYYTLFPNFHPWGGYNRIVYRFRPYKNQHDKSIMECYYLSPYSGERPPPAKIHWLAEDQHWTEAEELGVLAKVFTQDTFNLPHVQTGLEAAQYDEVVLARYQETKIRHFHHLLSQWIGS